MLVAAAAIPIVLVGGLWIRYRSGKGIDWEFTRYLVAVLYLPIILILAMVAALDGEILAGLLGGAIGFAAGKVDHRGT